MIQLFEDTGEHLVGLICDGTSTNRSMWKELGIFPNIKELINQFENPLDDQQKVFEFSNAPNLMKTTQIY